MFIIIMPPLIRKLSSVLCIISIYSISLGYAKEDFFFLSASCYIPNHRTTLTLYMYAFPDLNKVLRQGGLLEFFSPEFVDYHHHHLVTKTRKIGIRCRSLSLFFNRTTWEIF